MQTSRELIMEIQTDVDLVSMDNNIDLQYIQTKLDKLICMIEYTP